MPMRDLIPWNRTREMRPARREGFSPFMTLHREMDRLFDEALRDFDFSPFRSQQGMGWPSIEVTQTDKDVKVIAELPGLDEKDVQVELAHGLLAIRGEKKTETEDKDRLFSERYYGRFERRIPVEDVDEDKISASFKNGVLTVTMPKVPEAQSNVKRIAINGR
jgi:HSP20 family protein